MTGHNGEAAKAAIVEEFTTQLRAIAEASRRRVQLTATGTAAGGRVRVTVNADGVVIATRFSADIADLSYDEIAKAMTTAAQNAATDVARQGRELLQPLRDKRARLPRLSDLIEGMPDLESHAPTIEPASLAPPHSRERLSQLGDAAPECGNAVDYEAWTEGQESRGATDSGW
ncbi:YbaB/EbfC family DNA-binding protein [Nocardia seriolae]|uniref:YbaB/EbfC family nucleoid-associated protein n=1 Tax=Nocardia seriolae TaxID=37332 RepID=UPI0012BCABE3|nr:YbaB/EbfC family nucleoid-associated protein [Nocardia seriolae]MTJ60967.1 YbaB/EbfC family DNA-binding protein [Nocardia seriolae]MTJ71524.1 YbaB/EbfC family DNA-binding protein [Nocardia seriolae]MTJ90899.1 YbaB/EbfC family DNA-binding protein [Nocardia seriolae]MTK34856.1 YbaB/EbfC family DNA-binding protein [Nocardia seriolae]MTK38946.1 YbaB/EbfC family DNA-binding protein [Nocardia seriolae]